MEIEKIYMARAMELAELGEGAVNPNPLVGAVLVKDSKIIGEGYHKAYGLAHAEVEAIYDAREKGYDPAGSSLFVNLEPCSHYGKTAPCSQLIIENKISKVYIAMEDPNPKVAGRGIEVLRQNNIEVSLGLLEKRARRLNRVFIHYMEKKIPFVVLKYGMTLDGKIATRNYRSKWITNETSRADVQKLRNSYMGILVGINTVLKDDPRLNCRLEGGRDPIKIVLDSSLRIPLNASLLENKPEELIVFTSKEADTSKKTSLENLGVRVIEVDTDKNGLNLDQVLRKLGELGIDSLLVEGGGNVNYSFLASGNVDRISAYIATKLIGGSEALSPVEGLGIDDLKDSFNFKLVDLREIDGDVYIEAERGD